MAKNMHKKTFSEETKLKLDIFRECFREWLPVFVQQTFWKKLYIYDFFAGSGYDIDGTPGSPIILLEESKGEKLTYCNSIKKSGKEVKFIFNEHEQTKKQCKFEELKANIEKFIKKCKTDNNCNNCCFDIQVCNIDFGKEFKTDANIQKIIQDTKNGKFIILDQYGFTQVDSQVFKTLVNAPHTDFIFFISSSFLKRFKEHPVSKKFIGDGNLSFDEESNPKECHQVIVKYFESMIPLNKEYYLNHFTIKKGSNYYGLIFGTAHTLGMEKFQRVCWNEDIRAGESNCNTQNDFETNTLFGHLETNKIHDVKEKLTNEVLSGKITDNINGLKRALSLRCMPIVFTETIKDLERRKIIKRTGCKGYKSTGIHNIKVNQEDYYTINILQ